MSGKAIAQVFKCCVAPEGMASPAASVLNGSNNGANGRRPRQGRARRIDISMIGNPTDFRHTVHIGSADVGVDLAPVGAADGAAGGLLDLAGLEALEAAGASTSDQMQSSEATSRHLHHYHHQHRRDFHAAILYQMSSKDNTASSGNHVVVQSPRHLLANARPIGFHRAAASS